MIKVSVKKEKNYPVSSPKLKGKLKKHLRELGIVSDSRVSVALVEEATMKDLGQKFLSEKKTAPPHNVLSFPEAEVVGEFVSPPKEIINLGEIVVCYPKAKEEAKKEGVLIEERVWALVEHAALHLLGIHHH